MEDPTFHDRRQLEREKERRMVRLEDKVDQLDAKVDALSNRLSWLFGALAVLSLVANIIGPIIVEAVTNR